ncbi:MAG TPA: serine hydrolase domain-containing protein [Candidatus Eremiobacteraceae bacterium]|nr:serine hydrolase domain-containing protein [Candidatus Eremiobacteraceae bacterium]
MENKQVLRRAVTCAAVLLGISLGASARQEQADEVDRVVEADRNAQKIPGLSLVVCHEGKIVKVRGYGLANVELNVPVTPESIFQTGSVGKQFTSMAVMMLVEQGKLGLDDHIVKYLPESPAAWNAVTVRQLLTHTSGISDYGGEEETMGKGVINFRKDYTEEQLIQAFAKMPMDFAPGDKWSYSNTGYVLLGIIIHRVTGEFYGDFLQQNIFKPLGMSSTRIISEADIVPHRSSGYRLVKGELKNQEWVSPSLNTTADGALYTNVLDLAKWDAALYGKKLVKASSYEAMWTAVKLNSGKSHPYGFGWDLQAKSGHRAASHDGAWQGFTMNITRYLDENLTVIVMTNLDENNANPAKISEGVAKRYLK